VSTMVVASNAANVSIYGSSLHVHVRQSVQSTSERELKDAVSLA